MTAQSFSVTEAPQDVHAIDGNVIHAMRHFDGFELYRASCTCSWTAPSYSTARTARVAMMEHAAVHQEPGATVADHLRPGQWFTLINSHRPHAFHLLATTEDTCGKRHLHLSDGVEIVVSATQPVRQMSDKQVQERRPCHCCGAARNEDCQLWCPDSPRFGMVVTTR